MLPVLCRCRERGKREGVKGNRFLVTCNTTNSDKLTEHAGSPDFLLPPPSTFRNSTLLGMRSEHSKLPRSASPARHAAAGRGGGRSKRGLRSPGAPAPADSPTGNLYQAAPAPDLPTSILQVEQTPDLLTSILQLEQTAAAVKMSGKGMIADESAVQLDVSVHDTYLPLDQLDRARAIAAAPSTASAPSGAPAAALAAAPAADASTADGAGSDDSDDAAEAPPDAASELPPLPADPPGRPPPPAGAKVAAPPAVEQEEAEAAPAVAKEEATAPAAGVARGGE